MNEKNTTEQGKQPANKLMRAALCDGPGKGLEIREIPVPEPGYGQLLVKLESCGICHSDLHLRNGDENLPDDSYPLLLGHEGIGRVVKKGAGTDGLIEVGTRVGLPWIYDTCLDCQPCLTGQETYCGRQTVRGIQHHGAFAEFALADAKFACVLPEEVDPVQSAPLLCAGLTAFSALKKTRISPTSNVLIIGAGGLGQYAISIAKIQGAKVFVVDQDQKKLENATSIGADETFLADAHAGEAVKQSGGADVILNFAPSPLVWKIIEIAANPLSDIVAVALVYEPVDFSMMWLIDEGHRVFGSSVGTRQDLRDLLGFSEKIPNPIEIESIPLSEVNHGLDRLQAGNVKGRLCIDFSLE